MSLSTDEIKEIDNILGDNLPFSSSQDDDFEDFSFDDDVKEIKKDSLSNDDFLEMDNIVNSEFNSNKNTNPIIDKLSDEDKKLYRNGDVNYNVLSSMPAFDDETLKLYGLKNNSGDLFKQYINPDIWNDWQQKGKIGIQEAWQKKKKHLGIITDEMIPFWGSSKEAAEAVNVGITFNRLMNGETVREQDEEKLREYILELAEIEARGGYTFGGNVLEILTNSSGYVGEIGAGIWASAASGGLGLGVLAPTFTKATAIKTTKKVISDAIKQQVKKEIFKETVKKQVAKEIRSEVVKKLPKVATTTLGFGATKIPQRYVASFMDKQLSDGIAVTPVGDVILSDTDNTALNIMKAFGDTTFDVLTETSGFMFSPLTKYISKPVRNFLPKEFYTNFDKLVQTKWGKSTGEVLKKYGYDGVIEEMGEELLNRFLCQTFGINGLESYNLEGFLNNVLYKNDPSKWGQEAVAFALTSAGGHALVKGASSINKYSAEKHFLDNGYIRMKGSQSLSEQELRKIFEEKNISNENINNYFETHTEDDFRQALYHIKKGEADEKQIIKDEKLETESEQVKDKVYTMLTENGMSEDEADNISRLFKARSKIGQKWANGSALDWFNNLALRFKNDKQNNEPTLQGSVVYNQGAYHGTPHKFDKFSTEHIGSGEGNQAHGWGLYFAENKDVSEGYRKSLIDDYSSYDKMKYKGKSINDETLRASLYRLKRYGLNDALKYVDKKIDYYKERYKTANEKYPNSTEYLKNEKSLLDNAINVKNQLKDVNTDDIDIEEGQLFEVDIPENDVLLDEDKLLGDMQLKKGLVDKLLKWADDNGLYYKIDLAKTGKQIYSEIVKNFMLEQDSNNQQLRNLGYEEEEYKDPFKQASELLNSLGFKGITYEGKQDGRCYVVFDDKAINVLKTFYQGKKADDNISNSINIDESEDYIKSDFDGVEEQEYIKLEINSDLKGRENEKVDIKILSETKLDLLRTKDNTVNKIERSIKNYLFGNGNTNTIFTNERNNLSAIVNTRSINEMINEVHNVKNTANDKSDFRRELYNIIANSKELFKTSEYILSYNEAKILSLKNKQKIHKYANLVNTKYGSYVIIFTIFDNKKENTIKIYDLEPIKQKDSSDDLVTNNATPFGTNISITDLTAFVKSKVKESFKELNIKRENKNKSYSQGRKYSDLSEKVKESIQNTFGISVEEITNNIRSDIQNVLSENEIEPNEIDIVDVRMNGSYITGKNNKNSDIDFILEYKGDMSEDGVFNILADENFYILDTNGNEIKVDINPVKAEKSGTIDDYNKRTKNFDKTFYQGKNNTVDWTNRNETVPTYKELETSIKELAKNNEAIDTLSSDWKIAIKGSNRYINKLTNQGNFQKLNNSIQKRHNKYALNIKELINNSTYSHSAKNDKPIEKPSVLMYHYFDVNVKIGDKTYWVRLECEENKKSSSGIYGKRSKTPFEDSNNLTRNNSSVKTVNLYNIKEMRTNKSYSQGGEEYDFTEQIFGPKRINIENKEEYDNFIDKFSSEEERAKITFTKNALNRPESIIELFENADRSSFLHEMGHLFLEDLINASKTNEEAKKELEAWNNYLGYTGGEYTEQMHERFAKGFEVYLMNGKAPTNSIRNVFETFKDWLREIYNFVLSSNGALSQDVYKLYDSLFKDYNPDDEEVIKNILASARSAYNNVKEGNKPLNAEQKKYRETAYDILAYGLKMNKAYLKKVLEGNSKKYAKQQEKIENAIANIDDAFSSREGMLPEWLEFFHDTGVSDNSQTGGDYELAQKAYDVIVNKTYLDYDNNYNPNEFDTALFEKLDASYNYILDLYKHGDAKQKDYAIAAMYEWLENSLPSEIYQETFTDMFQHDVNEIDRHENMSRFEIAKEVILNNAKDISLGEHKRFTSLVINTINSLDFLTASDKEKIFNNLMQYENAQALINDIDSIMDIAETMDSQNYFKNIENKIQKALAGTKNIKQGNKFVGKYTREVNAVFEDLRRFNRLQKQQARKELEMINLFEGEDTETLSFEDKLRRKFLYYKATPSMYVSNDFMADLYSDIKTLKNWGFLGKQKEKLLKKVDVNVKIEKLLRVLDKKKDAKTLTKGYISGFGNWESIINAIFDENTKDEYSLLDKQAQVQVWQNDQKQTFLTKACGIFNVDRVKLDNLLIDKLSEKYKFLEYGAKRNHLVELNKMNIIEAFIWYKNDNLKERLINMYGEDGLAQMFKLLDEQEIEFANLLQRTAEKYYDEANKVYIRKYGIELPKVKNYFPSKTERVTVVDLLNDFAVQSATTPSFIKNRTNSTFPIMKFDNPVNVLFSHIDKMGVFINMTDTIDLYNKIFTDTDLKKSIIEKYGETSYKALGQMLANSSYNKQAMNIDSVNKAFSKLINNFIASKIILKPSIMIKQLLSCVNYAENMPVADWCGGFLKAISNPKKTIDFMMQDDYLKARFQTGGQNEYLQHVIEHSRFAKTRKFIDFLSLNVKIGDIGAIVFGGKPYIDYLMNKKGMTKENAFKQFRLSTMRSQQASMTSSLSNFQNNYNNPWVRGLFSFRNTPNQYFRKVADAFISYSNGDISKTQCAKTVFIYTFLNAFLYNTATTLSIVAFAFNGGDDDDDLERDVIKSIFDFNSQAIPVIGDIYSYLIDKIMGINRRGDVSIPAVTDLFEIVDTVTSDDVSLEDYFDCMTSIADITTGFPVQSASNMVMGGVDVVTGKPSGLLRMTGYTKKRAEKVTNTD